MRTHRSFACAAGSLVLLLQLGSPAITLAQVPPAADPAGVEPGSSPTGAGSTEPAPSKPAQRPRFLNPEPAPTPAPSAQAIAKATVYSESKSGRAVLVMKDGVVIAEQYANGWSAERPHPLASGTKSFSGVTAAAAVSDGLITLDELVSDTITEWKTDPRASRITVRELLNLTSGLEPNSELLGRQGYGIKDLGGANDLASRLKSGERAPENWYAAAVKVPVTAEPGRMFRYGPTHFYAWGEFLTRTLAASSRPERTCWDYMHARVLKPAGLEFPKTRFALDQQGNPNLPGGAHLTAREWAQWGEFVRRGCAVRSGTDATWTPVIDRDALEQCFIGSRANPQYGLTWWLLTGPDGSVANVGGSEGGRMRKRLGRGERPGLADFAAGQTAAIRDGNGTVVKAVMAAGAGKQRLYILPEHGLVIVRFAEMEQQGVGFSDTEFLKLVLGMAGGSADDVR
ncbi:MAG: serine hydrolase [Bacteroidia bacterium]|nr:serine hydrolase [Bacteroidia bacterium]